MRSWKLLALPALAAAFTLTTPAAPAQISVQIGAEPGCPYGYYAFAPYNCAPWGYYGPEWFNGGVFIGAGPWFHGPHGFHGYVDHHYDPHYGYHGPYPGRGEHGDPHNFQHFDNHSFHGNAMHDGQGHEFHGGGDHHH